MAKTRSSLASKRTTGPSANTIMLLNLKQTRCDHRDSDNVRCEKNPVLVKNLPHGTYKRYCMEHVPVRPSYQISREFQVESFLKSLGWS